MKEFKLSMKEFDLAFDMKEGSFIFRVGAIIIKDNKLLLAKNHDFPYFYTLGGKVKLNETSEEAIVREVFEETGVVFEIERLAFIHEHIYNAEITKDHCHEIVLFYLMKENYQMDFTSESKESLHWIPMEHLDETYLFPDFFKKKLLNNISGIEHIISK